MDVNDYVRIEQTKAVYQNTRVLAIGIGVVTLVTSVVFWAHVTLTHLLFWWFAALLIIAARLLNQHRFNLRKLDHKQSPYWLVLSCFWSFATGVHWGIVPVFFLSDEATLLTLFVSIVYTGHLAGAISTNAAYHPGFIAVAVPTTTMFAGRFLYEGGAFYNTVAIMVLFYFFVCIALSRNSEKLFREARELTHKNMQLSEELLIQKEAAEAATQTKDNFLAAASHDLRQPLHSSGLLLSALDNYVHEAEGRSILRDIRASSEALNHSFNSLLDVSRLDAGVVTADKQNLTSADVVQAIVRDTKLKALEKGLQFTVDGDTSVIYTDPILLERVLGNLLSNAVDYTETGHIKLEYKKCSGHRVRFLIRDSGIGIARDQLNDVFSEYYQISNPERDREKGFGLGLAIVARLCKILAAELYVCSELHKGTTFAVYLQAGEANVVRAQAEQSRPISSLNGLPILVVDDDVVVQKSMRTLLETWGAFVTCVGSKEQALNYLIETDTPPALVIADYRLRGEVTGVEVIEALFDEINQTIPAIIITGDTSPERLQSINASGFPVLHKPVTPAILRSAIQTLT